VIRWRSQDIPARMASVTNPTASALPTNPGFTGRAAIGYDHGYDGEIFYLRLALDEKYVEGSLGQFGEDDPGGGKS
jgi:hypothetical protein